jgi:5-methyltetrahydropteroyltriglutamate--homocysteine methyltransferase
MLTGPVTMLQWSFVRDDVPRALVCRQIALGIRDEVADLEAAGIGVIQVMSQPSARGCHSATRIGRWPASAGRPVPFGTTPASTPTCATGVQRYHAGHCHLGCGCNFDRDDAQPNGTSGRLRAAHEGSHNWQPSRDWSRLWDIHSPRVPDTREMAELLGLARQRLEDWQIWVNPDCGLKARRWDEVRPALEGLVAAARQLRQQVAASDMTPSSNNYSGRHR